jgi:phosphomannomutase
MKVSIDRLMEQSGVKFGTSGARGLVTAMADQVCYSYTKAFLQYLQQNQALNTASTVDGVASVASVAIGGDLRPSTLCIMRACGKAAEDLHIQVIYCGPVPSPVLANYGLVKQMPTVMVTGSHIPADRNGIKFTTLMGEITKQDEQGITAQKLEIDETLFDGDGALVEEYELPAMQTEATELFIKRYTDFYDHNTLKGLKIGFYQHSTVGRELFPLILQKLGAQVELLGYSDTFVPVDTEAIRKVDRELALEWAKEYKLDAIVSADGDCDRPLLACEDGEWLGGDILGILAASALHADGVAAPVSCNTALEQSKLFAHVLRTKIGSPYVIEGMQALALQGGVVVGYEANGGFLLQTPVQVFNRQLDALPTRDAILPVVVVLAQAAQRKLPLTALLSELPHRYTYSNRLTEFDTALSVEKISRLDTGNEEKTKARVEAVFGGLCGALVHVDRTDGMRMRFANGEIVHLRPSGNAPELRCYNEAASALRVRELNNSCMNILESWRRV